MARADELPATMRVVACTESGGARVEERPVPRPGGGELLLATRCCGLCGTDLFKLEHRTVGAGTVLGHELVGTVAALGPEVTGFAIGERVAVPHHVACARCALCRRGSETACPSFAENLLVPGGFADYVLVRERAVRLAAWVVPDAVADEAAVFLEPAACVLRGVERAALPAEGGCAVVLGGGCMGLLHLLVLRAVWPQGEVVVCEPLAERRALALELGAAAVTPPSEEHLGEAVARTSNGLGADAVFDTVGGAGRLGDGLALTRPGGVVVLFAHAPEGETAGFELNRFFKAERRLVATYSAAAGEQTRMAALLFSGRLDPRPLVSHRLSLARFAEAVRLAVARQALKVVLVPEHGGETAGEVAGG